MCVLGLDWIIHCMFEDKSKFRLFTGYNCSARLTHLAPIEHDQPFWLKSAELKVEAEVSISFQLQEKMSLFVCGVYEMKS